MAYRATERTLADVLADIERRLRRVEQPGCCPPDPNWVLADVDGELRFIYSHSGALGPVIGIRSGTLNYDSDSDVAQQIANVASGGAASGPAGGVLSGTYPNPGFAVDMATQVELDTHITDATDAHDASAISVVPVGTVASTDAQAAIAELDGDIQGHITDASDAHDASAISVVPVGSIASTDVQAALQELDTDKSPTSHTHTITLPITITIDGGGSAIATGAKKVYYTAPYTGTIVKNRVVADQSGSIVLDIWKDTYANFPPTVADTITASAKPTISAATKSEDATLAGWTTAITAGDVIEVNIDSCSTITRAVLTLYVEVDV